MSTNVGYVLSFK